MIISKSSTDTALTSFTGDWENVSEFASVTIAVLTDVDGTLYVDFSPDAINRDSSLTYNVSGSVNEVHRLTVTRKYFRIRYVNSTSSQSYLRIQCIAGFQSNLSAPLNLSVQSDADATIVRPTDNRYEIALSRRQGYTTWNKFGKNNDVDVGTETIWSVGGVFTRIDTASTFTIVSSSVQDTLTTGTGAWNVVIYYIDSTRTAAVGVVPLTGTTPTVTSFTGLGINRVALYNTGSGDINAGTITITATTGGTVQAEIPAGEGTTQQCLFFSQAGHTALLDWMLINVTRLSGGGAQPTVIIRGWVYSYVSTAKYLVFQHTIDSAVENTVELNPSQPFVVGEKSIFWLEATTDTNNTTVSGRFSLVEVRSV